MRTDSSPIGLSPSLSVPVASLYLCVSSRYADSNVHDVANSGGTDDPVEYRSISRSKQHDSSKYSQSWICIWN